MRLQINAVHFAADQKLLEFVQKKLNKLDTFHDRITGGEVFLKLDGPETSKVKDKIVEVRLHIPGKDIFVTERDKSFESAIDGVLEVLKDKLVRLKEKRNDFSSPAIVEARDRMEVEETEEIDDI